MRKHTKILPVILSLTLLLGGCAGIKPKASEASNETLHIVATTTILADLANAIGKQHVTVSGLMGPGIDPHLYQASAGDVALLQKADIVLYNGLHLEGKMGDVFRSLNEQSSTVICIENGLDPAGLLAAQDADNVYDPHIWFDVLLWKDAAQIVADGLVAADPVHAFDYEANAQSYLAELDELDAYIRHRIAEIPVEQRVLVTAHDAFHYFGNAYDFEVRGLQGISTDAEAGTAGVSALADFIAQRRIKAIFIESSIPAKNIEALQAAVKARGFDVAIGGQLYSDSLGDEASGTHTYLLTVRANIDTIVDALK